MKSIRYGNGSYRAEAILKHTRDEYISRNMGKTFKSLPESNQAAKLGELWDLAKATQPAPETPKRGNGKPKTDPVPPTE